MITQAVLKARRKKLMAALPAQSVAIMWAAQCVRRNGDVDYPYRQHSDFLYLTGIDEAGVIAVFLPAGQFILFVPDIDPTHARWVGAAITQEEACRLYGADQAFYLSEYSARWQILVQDKHEIIYPMRQSLWQDMAMLGWRDGKPAVHSRQHHLPMVFTDLAERVAEQRLIKDTDEIAVMRQAARITVQGHQRAMQVCQPGGNELALSAALEYVFKQQGAAHVAYPSIVAAGKNACILHYTACRDQLRAGDLVLIDAGAEYQGYAADVTRTLPINGRFTIEQRAIYEIVLATQLAAIAAVKPGVSWPELEAIAVKIIIVGLLALGLLQGEVDALIAAKAHRRFFPHGLGHWLGLDVHDVGAYHIDGKPRTLQPGMVLTIEPGIYVPADKDIEPRWWHIGVRIEDDILVTEEGHEVLSAGLAKTIDAVEALCQGEG